MNYERRLIAAAELVLAGDRRAVGGTLLDPADLRVTATLKPHQVEGVSWLVRRHDLGVNVILGDEVLYNVLEQQFIMPRRLLMTGTPIQNNISELWALMHFCMPSIFGTMEQFVSTFKAAGNSSTGQDASQAKIQFKVLKNILKAFMLRRTKSLLIESGSLKLPPLTEITMMVPLAPLQNKVYMSILRRELPTLLSFSSTSSNHQSLQNIVIFYEQDWNPQVDKQALQRAHRIGQMNHVLSINLVTEHTIEEVIMRRAERKLQLSNNVFGQEDETREAGKDTVGEASDIRSLIFGLRMFDPIDIKAGNMSAENLAQLDAMAEKVVEMRKHQCPENDGRKFKINPKNLWTGDLSKGHDDLYKFEPGLNEASYLSWVEKFKEESKSFESSGLEVGRRTNMPEESNVKREADKKKAEDKRLAKWEARGYRSFSIKEPDLITDSTILSYSGCVQYVYGDCTKPEKVCPSEPAIIFSCVDNSGNWGHGGMFDALAKLSMRIPDAYHLAFECGDLHAGDLHLIKLNGSSDSIDVDLDSPRWVALAVVQSYNARRKVPRSNISISDLELCLSKASFSAAQNSASIHMPRIGCQDGSQRSEWYTVERLLRKYASLHGIKISVYYYRRPSEETQEEST